MRTMNISLPDALKAFVNDRVADGSYGSVSEYVRELIRKDRDRVRLRDMLLEGGASAPGPVADPEWFEALRQRVRA